MARRRRYCPSGPRDLGMDSGWIDILGTVDQAAASAALTYEAINDTPFMRYWWRHDQQDAITILFQAPHGWALDAVEPHIHLLCGSNTGGVVAYDGYACWTAHNSGLAVPALAQLPAFSAPVTIASGLLWQETIVSLGMFTPPAAAKVPSADLMLYVRRNGTSPTDTYSGSKSGPGTAAANLGIQFVDCHAHVNKLGTASIYR